MKDALSLIKGTIVDADKVSYESFSKAQIVCPECYEQVFKKEMFVNSVKGNTHFFSHYPGIASDCTRRMATEIANDISGETVKRAQALAEFNRVFRDHIKKASKKFLTSTQYFKYSNSFTDAENFSIPENSPRKLDYLKSLLLDALSQPINESIDESLDELEEKLLPIYWHLSTSYGENNLRFLTCVSLLCIFKSNSESLIDTINRVDLQSKNQLKEGLLGAAAILLSRYVNWNGSILKIEKFLKQFDVKCNSLISKSELKTLPSSKNFYKESIAPIQPTTATIKPYTCPLCGTQTFVRNPLDLYCRLCDNGLPKNITSSTDKNSISNDGLSKNIGLDRSTLSTRWFYSIPKNEFIEGGYPINRKATNEESIAIITTQKRWVWNKNNRTLLDASNSLEYSFDHGQIIAEWEANPMRFVIREDLSNSENRYVEVSDVTAI